MASVVPDPRRIKSFESEPEFEAWLGRARKIAALVAMLARGQTIVPNRPVR